MATTNKTTVTELATALGIAGAGHPRDRLGLRPAALRHVDDETWATTFEAFGDPTLEALVDTAYANGRFFAECDEGLRRREPRLIEWAGPRRSPGDEVTPVDLRIDHVYLVSCKYLSQITVNASPAHLFDRLLTGGHGRRGSDWFELTAPEEFTNLWQAACAYLGIDAASDSPCDLPKADRRGIAKSLQFRRWPEELAHSYQQLCAVVSERSATRWRDTIAQDKRSAEAMLWRLLRIGAAPYFVLGAHGTETMRLRVGTPWDWRQRYEFRSLDITPLEGGQPMVRWLAHFNDRTNPDRVGTVAGHVEIRWSHGRFAGPPEAKVYLDTPFAEVPGYSRLA